MRTAVLGAALRVAGLGAAFAGVFLELQVLLLACHVASVQEARVPQALLALLAPQTLPTLPRSLPLVMALLALLALAPLALALLARGPGVRRFRDLSFFRWE